MNRPIIDHDPDEPPPDTSGNGIYWVLFIGIFVGWIAYLITGILDWPSAALGLGTGCALAIWAIAVTGNKVPKWMRR